MDIEMIRPFSESISTGKDSVEFISTQDFKERKSPFQVLKKNKIPLTPEERKIVMARKAIWHHGPHGEPSPAVWKSKDSDGSIIFVTNTHRAYNTAKTLLGAIERYHKFIKTTASE